MIISLAHDILHKHEKKSEDGSCYDQCQMGVSKNRGGPPKSSNFIRFSIIFTIHFGLPVFLETPICLINASFVVLFVADFCEGKTSQALQSGHAGSRGPGTWESPRCQDVPLAGS